MEKVQFSGAADPDAAGAVIGRPPEAEADDSAVGAGVPDGPQSLPGGEETKA